jgi:hypothetical protein
MSVFLRAVLPLLGILTAGASEASAATAWANEPAGTNGCVDDTWVPTSTDGAPSARGNHTAVWTGKEMIVWGGTNGATNLESAGAP